MEWISTQERLPEKGGTYITRNENNEKLKNYAFIATYCSKTHAFYPLASPNPKEVTHWRNK